MMFFIPLFPIAFVGVMIHSASALPENSLLIDAFDLSVIGNASYLDMVRSKTKSLCGQHLLSSTASSKIPHNLWIAVKDNASSFLEWPNIKSEIELNPSWSVHICDNDAKDSFMENFFPNTSLLSSYRNINPTIAGASKADIWRYAVLYVFGGVYIDSDSQLRRPLDEVIKPTDEMIVAIENNRFDGDWCYSPHSEFSTRNIIAKYPHAEKMGLFKGRILTNWCIMSAPNHLFLFSALKNFVKLSKVEFLYLSNLKISLWDPFSKYVYCSTGPYMFTTSARKAVIEAFHNNISFNSLGVPIETTLNGGGGKEKEVSSYRLASKDFGHEGGIFKAVRNTKADVNHYTQITPTKGQPLPRFLVEYASAAVSKEAVRRYSLEMEGALIKGRSERNVYHLEKGIKRPIGSMAVMDVMNFSLADIVHVSDYVINSISTGPVLTVPKTP